jgi:hypothetical protein
MKAENTADLVDARALIEEFKTRLPSEINANDSVSRSKLPWKVLSIRGPLLYRVIDLAEPACRLYEENMMAAAFTLTRSTLETSAMIYWLYSKMDDAVKTGKAGKALDDLLMRALLGRRDRSHRQPINVLTCIGHMNKQFEGWEEMYSNLSEYAHPNWFGVMSLYGKLDRQAKRLNLQWPELGTRAGEGLPLLLGALELFKFYYDESSDLLPAFIRVCDDNLSL